MYKILNRTNLISSFVCTCQSYKFTTMLNGIVCNVRVLGEQELEILLRIKRDGPQQLSKEAKELVEAAATHFLTVKPRRTSVKPYGPRPKKQKINSGETSSTSDNQTEIESDECDNDSDQSENSDSE